jgi:CheY-like chemotaxis protein
VLEPGRTVLYADDSEDDRYLMAEAWTEAGIAHRLEAVEDGAALLRLLESRADCRVTKTPCPALALLDVKMPGLTGLETLERLRASPRWRALPALMLTSSLDPGDISRAYALGANGFLLKPSSLDDLVRLLRAFDALWLKASEFPVELLG